MRLMAVLALFGSMTMHAQYFENPQNDWYHLDMGGDGFPGMSTNKAYSELLSGMEAREVIVAVLDGGVDAEHEDLREVMWVNEDEIPGNGIDDDNNGYVDDIHGWNYLGNPDEDITYDNLEFTRVYRDLLKEFNGVKETDVMADQKDDYARYLSMKDQYKSRVEKAEAEANEFLFVAQFFDQSLVSICEELGVSEENLDSETLAKFEPSNPIEEAQLELVQLHVENDLKAEFEEGRRHFESMLNYSYNLDYDSRLIIGDDPNKLDDIGYGNSRVAGPRPNHGTHVAGIIAATRNNSVGIDGVANHARIMALRCVPDGDEHDKDVANAIRYAVDNGAQIINMSFGKSYSPDKSYVDEAVKYAEEKGVLLVHAAGNSNRNNDVSSNFPNDAYEVGDDCSLWIEVGASGFVKDETLVADFSNYGKRSVDVFAPGVSIYSTLPGSTYGHNQGTSMAAPMVSGVAAILMSYFPGLTAVDVKEIIESSGTRYKKVKVYLPGSDSKKTKLKKISSTGRVVNVYQAVLQAMEMAP